MVVTTPTPAAPPKRIKGAVAGPTSTPIRIDKGKKTGPGPTPIKIGKDRVNAAPTQAPIKVIKTQVSTPTPTQAPTKIIKTQVGTPTPTPNRKIKDQITSTTTPIKIPKDSVIGGSGRSGPINPGGPTPASKKLIPGSHNLPPAPGKNLGIGNPAPPPAPAPSSPTPAPGGSTNTSPGGLPVGKRLIPPGDKLPPSYTEPLTVTVQLGSEPHKPGSNMSVGAKVTRKTSEDGASFQTPVSGAEVSFSLDGIKPSGPAYSRPAGNAKSLGNAKTYPNGIASLTFQLPGDTAKGPHTIVADVAAGIGHPAGQGSAAFEVADKIVTLKLLLGGKAKKGQTITLTASADENGSALKTGHALFFTEDKYLGTVPFDQSGTSPSLKWTVPLDVAPGPHKMTAMVANIVASPPSSSVARATAEASLEMEVPVLYFEGADVSRHHNEPAQFSGILYLSKESKTPAPNQDVIVSWEGLEGSCEAKTDSKGQFSCTGPLLWDVAAGSHAVVVTLPSGQALGWDFQQHAVSSGKVVGAAMLNVVGGKAASQLKLNLPQLVQDGSKIHLTAKLAAPDGKEIAGRKVNFSVNGQPVAATGDSFYSGVSHSDGISVVEFTVPKPSPSGKIKVDAAFAGDENFLPSTDSGAMEHFAEKKQAYLKIISAPSGVVGQEITFQAQLSQSVGTGGVPIGVIAGQPLEFLLDYHYQDSSKTEWMIKTGTTGPDGLAAVSFKLDRVCQHLRVQLRQDTEWSAQPAETSLQILPAPSQNK